MAVVNSDIIITGGVIENHASVGVSFHNSESELNPFGVLYILAYPW